MIHIFLIYLLDTDLMLLIFFKNFSHLYGFLCLAACLKKHLLFSYDSLYIYFVQCVECKNGEQHRLVISTIQNLVSQKLSLYLYVDLR
jgi:hypothetical protein